MGVDELLDVSVVSKWVRSEISERLNHRKR